VLGVPLSISTRKILSKKKKVLSLRELGPRPYSNLAKGLESIPGVGTMGKKKKKRDETRKGEKRLGNEGKSWLDTWEE